MGKSIVRFDWRYYPPGEAGRRGEMLKRILLVVVLALQFAATARITVNHIPWPECFPCDDNPN
jgi:hypothetical protein